MSIANQNISQLSEGIYKTANWTAFIENFVSKLDPKPNVFIFNQGLWNDGGFKERSLQKQVVKAIADAGMISVYKTTTKWKDDGEKRATKMRKYERQICQICDHCLDLSWTQGLPEYFYADRAHFFEPVYSWFNMQLLNLLSSS
jgi:hypothetical protein